MSREYAEITCLVADDATSDVGREGMLGVMADLQTTVDLRGEQWDEARLVLWIPGLNATRLSVEASQELRQALEEAELDVARAAPRLVPMPLGWLVVPGVPQHCVRCHSRMRPGHIALSGDAMTVHMECPPPSRRRSR